MYYGLDYGNGKTNIDTSNGVRFGVINACLLGDAWYDESEADYGVPICPECGEEGSDDTTQNDYYCKSCKCFFSSDEAYGYEPLQWNYTQEGYEASQSGDDCDIFVIKSPYYTHAAFCSPCAPGACSLDNPVDSGGPKAYCFDPKWFTEPCPYPVYRVSDNQCIYSPLKD